MKVAVPVEKMSLESNVGQSFGLAPYILIYNTNEKTSEYLDHTEALSETASGVRASRAIADYGVKVLLVPRCGDNAKKILGYAEVLIYKSIPGTAKQNIDAFQSDQLNLLTEFHRGIREIEGC